MKRNLLKNIYDDNILKNDDIIYSEIPIKIYGIMQFKLFGFKIHTKHIYASEDLDSVYDYFETLLLTLYKTKFNIDRYYLIYETAHTSPSSIKYKTLKYFTTKSLFLLVTKHKIKIFSDDEHFIINILDNIDFLYDMCKRRKDLKYMTKYQIKEYIKNNQYNIFLHKPKIKLIDSIMKREINKILLKY